ncbi:DUF7662 domain-containing protein [Haloechinothrix salitolerans]|uniref:DUF7662 domain-containing protein n=1 Tax=Haloechinothrix salitolerans TaxID=926830 RepID=A0ABW2C6L3_9PSEU
MAGKYQPLTEHLASLASNGRQRVVMEFAEVSALVGGLPPSAYHARQWWANSSLTQAVAWREADWHVDQVDFARERVRYARGKVGGSRTSRTREHVSSSPPNDREHVSSSPPNESTAEPNDPDVDVRVRLTWHRAGPVTNDQGKLVFPPLTRSPGIYRLTFSRLTGQPRVYIGESDDLRRRTGNYRNPGPTQQTSQRIHQELISHLAAGGTVTMSVATSAVIEAGGETTQLPLTRKTARVLAEHAALGLAYLGSEAAIVNRDRGAE